MKNENKQKTEIIKSKEKLMFFSLVSAPFSVEKPNYCSYNMLRCAPRHIAGGMQPDLATNAP